MNEFRSITASSDFRSFNSDTTDHFHIQLSQPLVFEKPHILACQKVNTWFSFYNVSAERGNNIFKYGNGVGTTTFTIEDGNYTFADLILYIENEILENGDDISNLVFSINTNTGKVELSLTANYSVDFTVANAPTRIFGFDADVYSDDGYLGTTTFEGQNNADITDGVTCLVLHCNLVNGSSTLGRDTSDVIAVFIPKGQPSSSIEYEPHNLTWQTITDNNFTNIELRLTDQNGNRVNLQGEELMAHLVIKPMSSEIGY